MTKLFCVVTALIICLFAQNVFADSRYIAIYIEPPEEKYEVIGNISSELKATATMYDIIYALAGLLQGKADALGANALILVSIEHFTKVVTDIENYNINAFQLTIYAVEFFYKYNATAIKISRPKKTNISGSGDGGASSKN